MQASIWESRRVYDSDVPEHFVLGKGSDAQP